MQQDFHLSKELIGHEEDVRTVTTSGELIITGSRDKTLKIWQEEGSEYTVKTSLVGHSNFVSSVVAFPSSTLNQSPQGGLISGSRDLSVVVWSLESSLPLFRLTGHKFQVSSVTYSSKSNEVISASQDGTIRIHSGPEFKDVAVLEGHDGPVQAVLALPDGTLLSGGSDATIKLWSGNRCHHTFKGHTDTVRGLALLEGFGIVSASHDMTLKVWDFQGAVIADLIGHTAIVYSVATSASGLIASASEDSSARVWNHHGQCLAHIPHPGCVWDVAFLQNGDLVTACSDFIARIFTTDPSKKAEDAIQEAYQGSIAPKEQEAADTSGDLPAGLKLEDPGVLLTQGTKDSQIKVIREEGVGMAYSWDAASLQWEKVGQVCGAAGAGEMQTGTASINGQQYDQVIDVDISDGAPPLKLGVNCSDNPYDVADRFIGENSLPTSYRDQIVDFVVRNTGLKRPVDTSQNPDPFTGGGAYRPGSSAGPSYTSGQPSTSVTGGGVDPFTGASSSGQAGGQSSLPATVMLIFDSPMNTDAVGRKIRQLSSSLDAAPDMQAMALTKSEASPAGTLDRLLSSAGAAALSKASIGNDEVALLEKLLRWPAASLFPALDVARLVVLDEQAASVLASRAGPLELSPLGNLGSALAAACAEPQLPANQQLAIRLLCNAFKNQALRDWVKKQAGAILDGFSTSFTSPQKAVRGASFLLNLAIVSRQQPLDTELNTQVVSILAHLLSAVPSNDEDALHRCLLAIGTLMSSAQGAEVRALTEDLGCEAAVQKLALNISQKVSATAREVLHLLRN